MEYKNIEDLQHQIKNLRGRISTVHYSKKCEPKKSLIKKFGDIGDIKKSSVFQVRAGIDYENIATVKEKHESGERERVGLPESMVKIDSGLYHHKYTNKYYIGCAPIKNSNSVKRVQWYVNDNPVELDTIIIEDKTLADFLYSKDTKGHDNTDWLNLCVTNIESLSGI